MGIVERPDSKYFWLHLEREGLPPIRKSSRVPRAGATADQQKENRRLAELLYDIEMGKLAKQRHGIPIETARITFRAYADWYREHRTSQKRAAPRERSMLAHLVAFFGRQPLEVIDRALVQEYLRARTKPGGVAAATANREVDVLKDMLTWAVPKYLSVNPLFGMKRLRTVKRGIRILSFADERKLRAVIAREPIAEIPPVEGWALLVTALDTFMRLGDLVALAPDQVFRQHIHVEDPKIAPYNVALSPRARTALQRLRKAAPHPRWVFPSLRVSAKRKNKTRVAEATVMRWFAAACTTAKVPHGRASRGVTFHALRHTGATRFMARPGSSLRDLMDQGGWSDLESVMRYAHPSRELVAAVAKLGRSA